MYFSCVLKCHPCDCNDIEVSSKIFFAVDTSTDTVPVIDDMLCEHYHFEAITSLSTDHWAGELRRMNLERFFGRAAFRRVRCIGTGADKDDILREYERGHWWIEDKPENALAGLEAEHKPILIDHKYNRWFSHPDIPRAENFAQVWQIIKTA